MKTASGLSSARARRRRPHSSADWPKAAPAASRRAARAFIASYYGSGRPGATEALGPLDKRPRSLYPCAVTILLALLSGAAGLVYEVAWARRLAQLCGGSALAQTLTLAAFLGGLAAGGVWLARRAGS